MGRMCDLRAKKGFKFTIEASCKNVISFFFKFICNFFLKLLDRSINLLLWRFLFMI